MASARSNQEPVIIRRDGFTAEVRVSRSKSIGGEIFHYVVQRDGSPEIIHFGQELSLQRALESVDEFIDGSLRQSFPANWGA